MSEEGEGIREHIVKKYGPSAASFIDDPNSGANVMGRKAGITFNKDRKMVNTRRAHALMELLKVKGENDKANEFMIDLYKSYFEEGEDINDENTLKEKITKYGVDEMEAAFAMGEQNLTEISRMDRKIKTTYGVSGVPFFMIHPVDGSTPAAFSGAYPSEVIAKQLEKASRA